MARVGELFIALSANTTALSKDLKRSTKITQKSAQDMERAFKIVSTALLAIGSAAVVGLGALIKSSIDTADKMGKMAQSVGLSVESLSGLAFAAELSDINLDELGARLTNLNRRAKEGARGVKSYRQAFDTLGISLTDSQGRLRETEALVLDIADKFSKMEDGLLKSALATDIFSNAGVKMIPFLNQGREGIQALTDEARVFGRVISEKLRKNAEDFNDNLNRLKAAVQGLGIALATELTPTLNRLSFSMVEVVKEGEKVKAVAEAIEKAFLGLLTVHGALSTGFDELGMFWRTTWAASINVLRGDFVGAMEAFKLGFADMKQFGEVNLRGIREAWEETGTAITAQSDKVVKSVSKATETIRVLGEQITVLDVAEDFESIQFSFEHLKLSSQELAEAIAKQNAEVLDATEFLKRYGIQLGDAGKQSQELQRISQDLSHVVGTAFEDAILRGEGFRAVLQGILEDLARIAIRAAITKPLQGFFGGLFGFQHGGRPPIGRPALVGEAGPELFVPDRSGSIISNQALQSVPRGTGGKTVVVNQNFDFRGAGPGVMSEVKRGMRQLQGQTLSIARAQASEAALRSP